MNLCVFTGNLTRDLELRYTPAGHAVTDGTIAVNERFKKGEEWQERTLFLDFNAWTNVAERLVSQTQKGSKLLVEGKLEQENWEKDGQKRSKVVLRLNRFEILNGRKSEENQVEVAVEGSVDDIPSF